MFVASWGKDSKEIGYWGILKCENCKNYTHHVIYERANKVKLYFVTVAKYKKERYLVCPVCNAGYELQEDIYLSLIEQLPKRFDKEKTSEIWNRVNSDIVQFIKTSNEQEQNTDYATLMVGFVDKLRNNLVDTYGSEDNVNEIMSTYLKSLADENLAR